MGVHVLLLLFLLPIVSNAELVVDGTTLQNGDFPFTTGLPLYNYSCTGLIWPVSFLPGCNLNLTNTLIDSTSILVLAPWKTGAQAAGCVIYPDVIPQINRLPTLPCAVVFVSTQTVVGYYDTEPLGISTGPFLSSLVPLTLLPVDVGTTLFNSLITLATPQPATLTTEKSPYTVYFASMGFQGYRWFFFCVYLIGLTISTVYALLSLPLKQIQIYHYSVIRISALCFLAFCNLARVLELGIDPDGSTGVMNKVGRFVMAWCGSYAGFLAYSAVLLQWVALVRKLKGLSTTISNIATWGIKAASAFFPLVIIFVALRAVFAQVAIVTIVVEVILAVAIIFVTVCFFVFGTKLLQFLKESKKSLRNSTSALLHRKVAMMTIMTDVAFFLVLIALIFSVIASITSTIPLFVANHVFQDVSYTLLLIALLITLSVKTEREKTSQAYSTSNVASDSEHESKDRGSSPLSSTKPAKDSEIVLTGYEVPPAIADMLQRIDDVETGN